MILGLSLAMVEIGSAQQASSEAVCSLSRDNVRLSCPAGWSVLNVSNEESAIGNYKRSPDTPENVFGGPGKAWVVFRILPRSYRNLEEWIFAARKIAPESIETQTVIKSKSFGNVKITCLSSREKIGTTYSSYFAQLGSMPILLELNYRADDPKRESYQSAVLGMIEAANLTKSGGN